MNNFLLMTIANSAENLFNHFNSIVLAEPILWNYSIKKFTTFTIICDNIKSVISLCELINLNNIRMGLVIIKMKLIIIYQCFKNCNFIYQSFFFIVIACFTMYNFNCSCDTSFFVFCFINSPKSSLKILFEN